MNYIRLIALFGTLCAAFTAYADSHPDVNVVILGDSNTSIGRDDCSRDIAWSYWFKDMFAPASLRSYARSGATWTNTAVTRRNPEQNTGILADDNVIYNQVVRLKNDTDNGSTPRPDLILVHAGTNDAWFADKRPGIWSKTPDEVFADAEITGFITNRKPAEILSLAESVRYCCELLMEAYPEAQIILMAPQQSTAFDHKLLTKAADIIEQCGAQMSLNVIRQDKELGNYRAREPRKNSDRQALRTSDGTHTSVEGARRAGRYIARRVESMLDF